MATTVTRPIMLDSTGRELVDVLNNVTISSSNIINNVTSSDTDKALAANQGRVLDQTITSKVSALSTETVGSVSAFSTSSVYPVGSYVTYSGLLYRCKKAVTSAGVWNSANWELVNLQELKNNVESAKRNMGELVYSSVPLTDAGLKLADGSSIASNSAYADFYNYIVSLYNSSSPAVIAGTAADTGKYVYDSANSRIFLPNLNNLFIEGTTTASDLGKYMSAGLPNITGDFYANALTYGANSSSTAPEYIGALYGGYNSAVISGKSGVAYNEGYGCDHIAFDASRSNSIYGNSGTVQPPAVKQYIYIVVANTVKTDYTVNIDNVMTDINMLATEVTNASNTLDLITNGHYSTTLNANELLSTGTYYCNTLTNGPAGANSNVQVEVSRADLGPWVIQTCFNILNHSVVYYRIYNNGTFYPWINSMGCERYSGSSGSDSWNELKFTNGLLLMIGHHTCSSAERACRGSYGNGTYYWSISPSVTYNTKFITDNYFISAYPNSNGYMDFSYKSDSTAAKLGSLGFTASYTGPDMYSVQWFTLGFWI